MAKNIGFTKKFATLLAKTMCTSTTDAYAQKEEHWYGGQWNQHKATYQWVVVLQKKVVGR